MQPNVNVKGQWPRGATDGPRTPRALSLNELGNWRTRKTRQRNRSTLAKQGQVTFWVPGVRTARLLAGVMRGLRARRIFGEAVDLEYQFILSPQQ